MTRRLYLRDGAKYRVRTPAGRETLCRWSDLDGVFLTGRRTQIRAVPMETLAAIKRVLQNSQPRRWYPLDQCFRAIHAPRTHDVPWVHPIRARALGAAA